jgi:hypothetical protein
VRAGGHLLHGGWRRCACLDAKTRGLAVGALASTTCNNFIADLLFLSEVSHSFLVAGAPALRTPLFGEIGPELAPVWRLRPCAPALRCSLFVIQQPPVALGLQAPAAFSCPLPTKKYGAASFLVGLGEFEFARTAVLNFALLTTCAMYVCAALPMGTPGV